MSGRPFVLVLGGARSGKSRFAMERAEALGRPWCFVATAEALDDEMGERIARHQVERSSAWRTVEAPRDLGPVLEAEREGVVLIDCLTLWLANVLGDDPQRSVEAEVEALERAIAGRHTAVVAVANEVGWGLVPDNPLGRAFRDEAGRLNQRLAACADEVHLVAAGIPLRLR